jgi:hypothetical protein
MPASRLPCVPLALPVLCVLSCSDTGRARGTQRLDSDRALVHAKSWVAAGWGPFCCVEYRNIGRSLLPSLCLTSDFSRVKFGYL